LGQLGSSSLRRQFSDHSFSEQTLDTQTEFDVVIVGGGPGGSTLGGLLRKYDSNIRVLILERETFPRDHVGESQLPQLGGVLQELGVWDQVERAGFPVKVGATYKWGRNGELWNFNFVKPEEFDRLPRPGRYEGIRRSTAFQVDRARYDDLLLRNAQQLGCDVRQATAVCEVEHQDDAITALKLSDGSCVKARYYVDASGHLGVLRRALGVQADCPTLLKNIAIWSYWNNTQWADTIGKGGTRVQVISVGFGWLWFIPISPTRTSLGLVVPASYYKQSGKSTLELYEAAINASDRITGLLSGAARESTLSTTNDWSFVSERLYGENWFLVGEAAGFADPILAAGLTLTHVGAKELAYTILALHRNEHPRKWLVEHYQNYQQRRIRQHMRFAEFWYSSNGLFTDLREHCQEIAKESGLSLTPEAAWAWLAQGGFTNDVLGQVVVGGHDFASLNQVSQRFLDQDRVWQMSEKNVFRLNLDGATQMELPDYQNGKILRVPCYERAGKRLPLTGLSLWLVKAIAIRSDIAGILQELTNSLSSSVHPSEMNHAIQHCIQILEVLVNDGWVEASFDPRLHKIRVGIPREGQIIHTNTSSWTGGSRESE